MITTIERDLRFALRNWRCNPRFTVFAGLALAVGIGTTTAAFSVVNAVLLRGVVAEDPEQLVNIYESRPGLAFYPLSYPDYLDLEENTRGLFSDIAAAQHMFVQADSTDTVETLLIELVSGNSFPMLGIGPHVGRLLSEDDHVAPGSHPVAVLGYGYWQRAYAANPDIAGEEIRLNHAVYTIVGVVPESYRGALRGVTPDLYLPILMINELQVSTVDALAGRQNYFLNVRGRLAEGATLAGAQQAAEGVAGALRTDHPDLWHAEDRFNLVPTSDVVMFPQFDRAIARAAWMLLAGVSLVLLVACSNLAGFLIVKYVGRSREIAVRLALGATRRRLIGQLLTETALLTAVAGIGGLGIAVWLVEFLETANIPAPVPMSFGVGIDPLVLVFTFAIVLGTGVVFGVAPALRATRRDPSSAMRGNGTSSFGQEGRSFGLRDGLLVVQVGLSLIVLVASGLLLRSFQAVYALDPGFGAVPTGITSMSLPTARYGAETGVSVFDELTRRISALPGVRSVGATTVLHLTQFPTPLLDVTVDGVAPPPGHDVHSVDWAAVDTGFFGAAGIEIRRGRNFALTDGSETVPVAIISEAMAERFWPGGDALGKAVRTDAEELLVVGVAADVKVKALIEPPRPFLYRPLSQHYSGTVTLLAATDADAENTARDMVATTRELVPDAIVFESKTMERHFEAIRFSVRFAAMVSGGLALLTLALATTGLYGLVSFNQIRRQREVGIRMSLGADARSVVRLLVKDGLKPVLIGAVVGLVGSLWVGRLLSGLLVDVDAWDPATFVVAMLILATAALVAAWWPARRASRLNPLDALRGR